MGRIATGDGRGVSQGGDAEISGIVAVAAGNGCPLLEFALLGQDDDPLLENGVGDKEAVIDEGEEGNLIEVDLGYWQARDL